jgi:hypothetical protein
MLQRTCLGRACHTACHLEQTPLQTVYLQHTQCYNCTKTSTEGLHGSTTEPRAEKRYQTRLAYGLQGWHRGKAAPRAEKSDRLVGLGRPRTAARSRSTGNRLNGWWVGGGLQLHEHQQLVGRGCRVTEKQSQEWSTTSGQSRGPPKGLRRRDKIRWSDHGRSHGTVVGLTSSQPFRLRTCSSRVVVGSAW